MPGISTLATPGAVGLDMSLANLNFTLDTATIKEVIPAFHNLRESVSTKILNLFRSGLSKRENMRVSRMCTYCDKRAIAEHINTRFE